MSKTVAAADNLHRVLVTPPIATTSGTWELGGDYRGAWFTVVVLAASRMERTNRLEQRRRDTQCTAHGVALANPLLGSE